MVCPHTPRLLISPRHAALDGPPFSSICDPPRGGINFDSCDTINIGYPRVAMQNDEARWGFEISSAEDDGIADYDDGSLGCEAMIGELNTTYCRPTYDANSVKMAPV